MISSVNGLRYAIKPCRQGWSWTVFDADGSARVRGEGPTRAVAAACVIRCIARDAAPAPAKVMRAA